MIIDNKIKNNVDVVDAGHIINRETVWVKTRNLDIQLRSDDKIVKTDSEDVKIFD